MARRSTVENLKPEVFELLKQGLRPKEIRERLPQLPSSTAYDWAKEFRIISGVPESISAKPIEPQALAAVSPLLPKDPETPLEKIKHALWDIVANPEGKHTAVQALNALVKIAQIEMELCDRNSDGTELQIVIDRRVIHANPDQA